MKSAAPLLVVHHLNNSRSQRILWMLEELELPYEVIHYERHPKTLLAPEALKQVHPLGKSPVLVDGDKTLAESGAILEYLQSRYGDDTFCLPKGPDDRLAYTYWLHYAEGSAMPLLVLKLIFDKIERAPMPFFARPIGRTIAKRAKDLLVNRQLVEHLDYIESHLMKHEWFAGGQISAADIQMSFPLEAVAIRSDFDQSYPKSAAFLQRIQARSAYQRALKRSTP